MTSSPVSVGSLGRNADSHRKYSDELFSEHGERFALQLSPEMYQCSSRIYKCDTTTNLKMNEHEEFRETSSDIGPSDSKQFSEIQACNSQAHCPPIAQVDDELENSSPDLEVVQPLRPSNRRDLSVATSDYDVSQETTNMTSPTCASSSQGYKSLSSSVTDIARPVRVCTACGGAGPPPGPQRLPGGCQKYTSPNWKGFRRILKQHRRRAPRNLPHRVDCVEQIQYPHDYTCAAVAVIFIAPLCGFAALFYSLRMRRSVRGGNVVSAWKYSKFAFVFITMGGVCLALMLLIAPMTWLLKHRQAAQQPSTPLPMIPVPMPTLSRDDLIKRNRHTDVLPPLFAQGNEGLIPVRDPYNSSQSNSHRISSVS